MRRKQARSWGVMKLYNVHLCTALLCQNITSFVVVVVVVVCFSRGAGGGGGGTR